MRVPPSEVDLPQAHGFLDAHLGGGVTDVELVGEGEWSRCFGFTHHETELVIRFGRHVEDFRRDRRASRFTATDLPVPDVTEVGEAFGAWYAISTRAHGTAWERLDHDAWAATFPSILATLDALRLTDIGDSVGYGSWDVSGDGRHPSWRDFLAAVADEDPPAERLHGWRACLDALPDHARVFHHAHGQMLELADAFTDERYLVHNDLLNRNALAADGRVTAVFDWGCSIYGDFLYELATFLFWAPWHLPIDADATLAAAQRHHAAIGLDIPDFDARLRCSALHIGLQHIGYNAFLGDLEALRLTEARMEEFLG
jgi:hygromycin-B 4-O-kinase